MWLNDELLDCIEKNTITLLDEPKQSYSEAIDWLRGIREKFDDKSPLYYNEVIINPRIKLRMPGKKDKQYSGDYCLLWDGKAPRHQNVCEALIRACSDKQSYARWIAILEDVYCNGTKNLQNYENDKERFAVQLLFWVTLQEDINRKHKGGRLIPLCRYAEAIATTLDDTEFTYEDVEKRIDSSDPESLDYLKLPQKPSFYKWSAF